MSSLFEIESVTTFGLLKIFLIFFAATAARYFLFTGVPYWYFWRKRPERFEAIRIPNRFKQKTKIPFEIKNSVITIGIAAALGAVMMVLKHFGWNQIYFDIHERGWGYFFFSIAAMVFIHDAYFYFVHRLMHHPLVFKHAHEIHHRSVNPTPFAAFSFHPLEAFIEAMIIPVMTVVMPVHIGAFVIFTVIALLMNVYGHLGFEIYPQWFQKHPIFKYLNSSTSHNLHHQWVQGNYGLYFNYWDRIFKTLNIPGERQTPSEGSPQSLPVYIRSLPTDK